MADKTNYPGNISSLVAKIYAALICHQMPTVTCVQRYNGRASTRWSKGFWKKLFPGFLYLGIIRLCALSKRKWSIEKSCWMGIIKAGKNGKCCPKLPSILWTALNPIDCTRYCVVTDHGPFLLHQFLSYPRNYIQMDYFAFIFE